HWAHNTSYHTDFPPYLWKYLRLPPPVPFPFLRTFYWLLPRLLGGGASVGGELLARGVCFFPGGARCGRAALFPTCPLPAPPARRRRARGWSTSGAWLGKRMLRRSCESTGGLRKLLSATARCCIG